MKARLTHAGMRPINNVVDVTNYVMLGWGQPLHAFDSDKVRGGRLIARRATAGETIVTLDGVERTLDDQMLVIADAERALVIAGVFGSQDAEIDEHTTDIVLEAANFAGPSILRTEMHTGIRSEASNRFEKGIDANLVPGGLDFAGRLFAELCGGTVAPGMVDAGGTPPAPAAAVVPAGPDGVAARVRRAGRGAGGILRRLECEVDGLGYRIAEGPEVKLDYYNFTALNTPPSHPARSAHDTFWVVEQRETMPEAVVDADRGVLLRTQTSPVQVRTMQLNPPPVYVVWLRKTYRREKDLDERTPTRSISSRGLPSITASRWLISRARCRLSDANSSG